MGWLYLNCRLRQFLLYSYEENSPAFLRHTIIGREDSSLLEFVSDSPSFSFDALVILPANGRLQAEHVFHDKNFGLKILHIFQELLIETAARVFDDTLTMILPITPANIGETLARRSSDDDIHAIPANKFGHLGRSKSGDVFGYCMILDLWEILFESRDGMFIYIDSADNIETRLFKAQ